MVSKEEVIAIVDKMRDELRAEIGLFPTGPDKDDFVIKVQDDVTQMVEAMLEKQSNEMQVKWRVDMDFKLGQAKSVDGRPKEGLTSKRAFSGLKSYSGKYEEYDEWEFQMRTFLNDNGYKELLFKLKEVKAVPGLVEVERIFNELDDERSEKGDEPVSREWLNHQLFQALCLNLQGKALKSVKLLEGEELQHCNGIIGWCKLAQDTSAMTSQRLQGLAEQVYSPKRCKKYGEVLAAIEEWELAVKLFQKSEDNMKLSAQTRIYSIRQLVPEELEGDIIRSSSSLTTFESVMKYITEQVTVRRDKKSSSGPVRMDLNYVKKTLASLGDEEYDHAHEDGEEDGIDIKDYKEDEELTAMEYLMSFVKGYKGGKGSGKGKARLKVHVTTVAFTDIELTNAERKTKK